MKMADDDEIDILGDFSFNSCLAQNNQGIPSCSSREDTVHPQWLLDSTATNWYDKQTKDIIKMAKDGPSRRLIGNNSYKKYEQYVHSAWTPVERDLLVKLMAQYGRNVFLISQKLKTKSVEEIQALIQAEYGVNLDSPTSGIVDQVDKDVPTAIHEEISATHHNIKHVLDMVTTGSPTIPVATSFRKKSNTKSKSNVTKTDIFDGSSELIAINPSEILYEDDLVIGSTESIGAEVDLSDIVSKNIAKLQAKEGRKNYRRKVSTHYDKRVKNRIKDVLKSPQRKQRNSSASLSDDSVKSPKMQIVLGSGLALPLSEGEQVIKIEKKKDSEPESDIEIDVDSDSDRKEITSNKQTSTIEEIPIAVPLRKFEPMPRRQKKINLNGGGGYTIMHTESGDMYEVSAEPKRERQPRKQPVHLIQCRVYNTERPAPFEVTVNVSAFIAMDAHAHTSRAEVMGLLGGTGAFGGRTLSVQAYRPAHAAAGGTHCDMDPVSQSRAAERVRLAGLTVCGWHHSHPAFPAAPSALDLRTQLAMQRHLEWAHLPFLGFITSQHWPTGRTASQYRCIRVEDDDDITVETPIGYQFSVKLVGDLNTDKLDGYLQELRMILRDETNTNEYSIDMTNDVCPQAGVTYLEKCISSVSHHMRSAGYADEDPVVLQLIQGIRDIFR